VVICLECGIEFKTSQHLVKRGEAKFCSQSCAAKYNNRERGDPLDKAILEELYYSEKLSMPEIAERLGCSSKKVVYWMTQYNIERRGVREAIYQWHNPEGDPFVVQDLRTAEEREFFSFVIGLYVGEGSKRKPGEISLSNTNPQVIRAFIRLVCEICGVERAKFWAWINIFDDVDLEEAQQYWEEVTGLARSQFYQPTIRQRRGGTYVNLSKFGTVTVGVSNTKLHKFMMSWCQEYLDKYS
jgi:predicted DNA-binding transcriptional regulator AlpA